MTMASKKHAMRLYTHHGSRSKIHDSNNLTLNKIIGLIELSDASQDCTHTNLRAERDGKLEKFLALGDSFSMCDRTHTHVYLEKVIESNRIHFILGSLIEDSLFKASFDEAVLIEERVIVAKELHEGIHNQLSDSLAALFTILSNNLNGLIVIFFRHLSLNFF
jgi:hypothetical protein